MTGLTPAGGVGEPMLSVGIQSLEVAVRAPLVREVLGGRDWVALPGTRDEVPGVVIWAGRAVAVLDLARVYSGLRPLTPGEHRARMLIIESPSGALALPADRVSEVFRVHEDRVRAREMHDFELARSEVVTDGSILPLFEPELLLERLNASGP